MQIEIYNPSQGQPLPPVEWNYPEVKKWIQDGLEAYKDRVYTEDTITLAKKDRATLNKLAAAIDGKRKEMKAMYLEPYNQFEAQAKELTDLVKAQSAAIDAQVKAYEESRRQEKQKMIEEVYAALIGNLAELVPYKRLHDPKWLNVTMSMGNVTDELSRKIERIEKGLASISALGLVKRLEEHIKSAFLKDFDLAAALAEKDRIEKEWAELTRYEEAQKAAQSTPAEDDKYTPQESEKPAMEQKTSPAADTMIHTNIEEKIHTVDFRVHATAAQLTALKAFLKSNNIKYGRVT